MKRQLNKRGHHADLFVDLDARPGWISAQDRLPSVGEEVFCVAGAGEISAILGKTGDGSRLLEIRLLEPNSKPYFAAASNVLVVAVPGSGTGEPPRRALDGSDRFPGTAVWLS